MSNFWKMGLSFVAGAVIGGFATKKYLEYKANQTEYVEEEIEEVEEENNEPTSEEPVVEEVYRDEKIDYSRIKSVKDEEYVKILNDLRYKSEQDAVESLGDIINDDYDKDLRDRSRPYNISQDEFEDIDSYESDEYTYYADGYLTDSYGMPVSEDDIERILGKEFPTYFGTYDDNQIWVRNERLQMDFSVIRDVDNFVDVCPPRIRRMVGL